MAKRILTLMLALLFPCFCACYKGDRVLQNPESLIEVTPGGGGDPVVPPGDETGENGGDFAGDGTVLRVISLTSPIKRGQMATLSVQGVPLTEYDIDVRYSSGVSGAAGLENKVSDELGTVTFSWRVGGGTKAGTYTIRATGGGESLDLFFTVTE